MNNGKNVVKKEQAGALAISNLEADSGKGLGNIRQEDLALPFLKILGQLSPEVNKKRWKICQRCRTRNDFQFCNQ